MPLYTNLINSKTALQKYKSELLQYYNDMNALERSNLPEYFIQDDIDTEDKFEKHLQKKFFNNSSREFHAIIHWYTAIGFLTLNKHKEDKGAHINKFFIREESRDKGSGKSILNKTMEKLKKDGFEWITLGVSNKNRKAHSLYKKVGFEDIAKTMIKKL